MTRSSCGAGVSSGLTVTEGCGMEGVLSGSAVVEVYGVLSLTSCPYHTTPGGRPEGGGRGKCLPGNTPTVHSFVRGYQRQGKLMHGVPCSCGLF